MGPLPALRAGTVVVVGDVITDVIVHPEGPLVRGSDRRARIREVPGGSGANQAAWLAALGVPARLLARVGAADAALHEALLRAQGVEPWLAVDGDVPSGRIVALIDPDGERSFFTDRGANARLAREDLPGRCLDDAALLHVSGYALFEPGPRAAVLDLVAQARRHGVPVSVDPGSAAFLEEVGPQAFLEWTRGATLLLPNAEEAALLAGTADSRGQVGRLAAFYGAVAIKRGVDGALLAAGARHWQVPAKPVPVVDTTGAGDAFLAGLVAAWRRGEEVEAALSCGVAAGARAVGRVGGRPT